MAQQEKEHRKFEEMNPFTEKVGVGKAIDASSDNSDIIYWDPDEGTVSFEDLRPLEASVKSTLVLHDEEPGFVEPAPVAKPAVKSVSPKKVKSAGFNIEDLAREIDSLDLSSSAGFTIAPSNKDEDFLSVLDDEQLNLIDEVVSQADGFDEIGLIDIIEDEPQNDKVSIVEEIEGLIESKPLWSDDDDFWLIDAEGFGKPPHELIAFLSSPKIVKEVSAVSAVNEKEEPAVAAPEIKSAEDKPVSVKSEIKELPFADKPYILSYEHDSYLVDMARLVDGEPALDVMFSNEAGIAAAGRTSSDDEEIVIVDAVYLDGTSHFDSIVTKERNDFDAERIIEFNPSDAEKTEIIPAVQNIPEQKEPESIVQESSVKMKLPDDFTLNHMDLGEAEKIAHEDIFFLSEDDLIEELELRDLVPIDDDKPAGAKKESAAEPAQEPIYNKKGEFTYIIPDQSQMTEQARKELEGDIQASPALIIEEDVKEISKRLKEFEEPAFAEQLIDITDRVIILEEEADVERFVSAIPEHKRDDMKRLLNYLDGLFEKLPEDVVKNFADSEYFDLYVKIMNDLSE